MPLVNVLAIRYAVPGKKGRIMGIIGLAFNCAPILGPAVSGFLLNYFSWRYLFILIIPFALAGINSGNHWFVVVIDGLVQRFKLPARQL